MILREIDLGCCKEGLLWTFRGEGTRLVFRVVSQVLSSVPNVFVLEMEADVSSCVNLLALGEVASMDVVRPAKCNTMMEGKDAKLLASQFNPVVLRSGCHARDGRQFLEGQQR